MEFLKASPIKKSGFGQMKIGKYDCGCPSL